MPQCFCPAVPPVAWSFSSFRLRRSAVAQAFLRLSSAFSASRRASSVLCRPRPHISGPSPGLFPAPAPFSAGWIRADSVPPSVLPAPFWLLSGHSAPPEARGFLLRKRFPQYILSTNVVASQGRCLQVVILNKGILSGSVSLFCLPQCLLISAYLALYPAGL